MCFKRVGMKRFLSWSGLAGAVLFFSPLMGMAQPPVRRLEPAASAASATVRVLAGQPLGFRIPAFITGKFAEHLGANIYGGMCAEILQNPTFADYPFDSGEKTPDGVVQFEIDPQRITRDLRDTAARLGCPESELGPLVDAYHGAMAAFWTRQGPREEVQASPDAGPFVGRAQRIEVKRAGEGCAQWAWLPLQRTRRYEFSILLRAPALSAFTVSLTASGAAQPCASAAIRGVSPEWGEYKGEIEVGADQPAEAAYKFALTADAPGQFVVGHVFLQPSDNAHGADPDIIRFLRASHLPLLRWPGGNFVSGYHWRDGVGPMEKRPTNPNYAWGGVEPNLFGTDEFIQFCRDAGCEPMICVNGGSGTPEEAAQWIEYCNGPADSPMGALRAANGHPEPYRVRYWEAGNELWGHWQYDWTTPAGYVDRYRRFAAAMRRADPSIHLLACGAPVLWGKNWNDTLLAGDAAEIQCLTDHPLIGGDVPRSTDPLDVYRDFMAVPEVLESKWSALRDDMKGAGIGEPHLAITELQLFAHLGPRPADPAAIRLTRENLPSQPSITEAIYDILIYHAAVRLGSFVELITHSAIVNHGGGLRKQRERVYANPCYYAQSDFAAFANAQPVPVEIASASLKAPRVLPELSSLPASPAYSAVDAMAALATNGDLLISLVNRDTSMIHLAVTLDQFRAKTAAMRTLGASVPWAENTLTDPEAITPHDSTAAVNNGSMAFDLPAFSIVQLRLAPEP